MVKSFCEFCKNKMGQVILILIGIVIIVSIYINYKKVIFFTYINRGNTCLNKGDYDQAVKDYTEAIRLKPDGASAYYNRGNAYFKKEEYEQAIKDMVVPIFRTNF